MRVIITGGTGFIGQLVAKSILQKGKLLSHQASGGEAEEVVTEIILADVGRPPKLMFDELEQKCSVKLGDISDPAYCQSLFEGATGAVSIFHFGAVMSGQGEQDFDLVMRVNLHGTLHLLEAARRCGACRPRFIMASAGATLGSGAPTDFVDKSDTVGDWTRATPHTSYGMTKACSELLLSDFSRRGFIDGRACRLPSVVVRAGAPNAATTGAYSSVVREPLAGIDVTSAIGPDVRHAVTGHRTAPACLVGMHELPCARVDEVRSPHISPGWARSERAGDHTAPAHPARSRPIPPHPAGPWPASRDPNDLARSGAAGARLRSDRLHPFPRSVPGGADSGGGQGRDAVEPGEPRQGARGRGAGPSPPPAPLPPSRRPPPPPLPSPGEL